MEGVDQQGEEGARDGDVELGSVMAGQISGLVNKRESVKEIIEDLFQEYDKVKNYFNKCINLNLLLIL